MPCVVLFKSLVNLSMNDFDSAWLNVSEEFSQRRHWIHELDAKLAAIEDTRVDRVCNSVIVSLT